MALKSPPKTYRNFSSRFPNLAEAWDHVRQAEAAGPLDEKQQRLLKLAVAVGAMREGAVHSSVRKARALGITDEEMMQVVALAASTLGFPGTVAVYSWIVET